MAKTDYKTKIEIVINTQMKTGKSVNRYMQPKLKTENQKTGI